MITQNLELMIEAPMSIGSALRLGRILEETATTLDSINTKEREDDNDFVRMWSQILTLYGMVKLAESFMSGQTHDEYLDQLCSYRYAGTPPPTK